MITILYCKKNELMLTQYNNINNNINNKLSNK
jgi:hypothetical protein